MDLIKHPNKLALHANNPSQPSVSSNTSGGPALLKESAWNCQLRRGNQVTYIELDYKKLHNSQ